MWIIVLALVQSLFPSADIAYAVRPMKTGTVIVVTYPTGGTLLNACAIFYTPDDLESQQDGVETERKCWTPTNDVADIYFWEDKVYPNNTEYLVCSATMQLPDGRIVTRYARPIRGDS